MCGLYSWPTKGSNVGNEPGLINQKRMTHLFLFTAYFPVARHFMIAINGATVNVTAIIIIKNVY
jgi:hypothetical protein